MPSAEVEMRLPPPSALASMEITAKAARPARTRKPAQTRTTADPQNPVWLLTGSGDAHDKRDLQPNSP